MTEPGEYHRLAAEHRPAAIRARLAQPPRHGYVGDAVLGGIDGCVTTFAVVAGAVGGKLSGLVIIVLGIANLLADGFSMAVSNYQATKTQQEERDRARAEEERHIQLVPEGEREEVRQIFAQKGFHGETLEKVVAVITQDRRLWVETMLTEERGIQLHGARPMHAALATFTAFLGVGLIPLVPFLTPGLLPGQQFTTSAAVTAIAFFGIGWAKGLVMQRPALRSGLETLLMGGGAAALAYGAGAVLRQAFGPG